MLLTHFQNRLFVRRTPTYEFYIWCVLCLEPIFITDKLHIDSQITVSFIWCKSLFEPILSTNKLYDERQYMNLFIWRKSIL